MPKVMRLTETVAVPPKVTVEVANRVCKVTGPRGVLQRNFRHIRNVDIRVEGKKKKHVRVEMWFGVRKNVASVRTVCAHIKNMITGVTKGFEYKMRFVYAHFPINCLVTEDKTEIKINNFLGEKLSRVVKMLPGVSVVRSEKVKDEIVLTGNDIDLVSQSAALIHQSTKVPGGKDIRKFLDGVYVSESHVIGE
jgi:large subunit ribosomal protein L9e